MYWDRLTPAERLAFTIGYALGRGVDFPTRDQIEVLRTQLGVIVRPGSARKPARAADGSRLVYDLALVAAAARTAIARGEPAALAVMAACGCPTRPAASKLISKARRLGHDIPHVNPGVAEYQRSRARRNGDAS